mmetsp:Transcript_32965/g.83178  ORF Transcript_32965/g.83178 Transcript_32965/m.83178 type:complete len:216 (-) Transcript_32965:206-853(-)
MGLAGAGEPHSCLNMLVSCFLRGSPPFAGRAVSAADAESDVSRYGGSSSSTVVRRALERVLLQEAAPSWRTSSAPSKLLAMAPLSPPPRVGTGCAASASACLRPSRSMKSQSSFCDSRAPNSWAALLTLLICFPCHFCFIAATPSAPSSVRTYRAWASARRSASASSSGSTCLQSTWSRNVGLLLALCAPCVTHPAASATRAGHSGDLWIGVCAA